MAYERTNWQNGDVISSEKLNKMEAGIEYACSLEHEVEDPTEGQVLKYDAEKEKFVNGDVAIETNIQNPTDGQTLKYDAESGKWVNGEGGSGGSGPLIVTVTEGLDSATLDKTWQEIHDAFPNVEMIDSEGNRNFITSVVQAGNNYSVSSYAFGDSSVVIYKTDSPTGYPATQNGGDIG